MSLGHYIILMTVATGVCWGVWYLVIVFLNPMHADIVGFILFYAALTLALAGSFALVGLLLRSIFFRRELVFQRVAIAFRQGIFFALLIDGFLLLQSQRLLTWYTIAFLLIALTIAELFFISRKTLRYR